MNAGVIEQPTDRTRRRGKPSAAKSWLKAIELTSRIEANPDRLFADVVEDWAARQPERPGLISDTETFSYRTLAERINRYARWALSAGIKPGDTVCLFMPGRPDYIAAWLGITKVGGVAALINTKLVGLSLSHCINVADADHVILAHDLAAVFETAASQLKRAPKVWLHGNNAGEPGTDPAFIDAVLERMDGGPLTPAERRGVTINDRALLIYTSGTTGLPKAASISHRRILNWGGWFAGLTDASPEDRLYDCLPLFHSVGGIVAPCSMLTAGASVVLAEKFSVGPFLARYRALGLHAVPVYRRALPLSSEGAAIRIRKPASAAAGLRQRSARRYLGSLSGAVCHSANTRILCRDRRQFLALQCRGQAGRDRPHSAAAGASFSGGDHSSRRGAWHAGALRGRSLHRLRPRRGRRSHRPDRNRRWRRRPLRGLYRRGRDRKENPARRARQRRCLVSHRRSDAARRKRLFPLCRPGRRYLPLERRECRDLRSERSCAGLPGRRRRDDLWRGNSRRRRPRGNGRDRGRRPV